MQEFLPWTKVVFEQETLQHGRGVHILQYGISLKKTVNISLGL